MSDDLPSRRRRPVVDGSRLPPATLSAAVDPYRVVVAVVGALRPPSFAAPDDAVQSDADEVFTRRGWVALDGGDRR